MIVVKVPWGQLVVELPSFLGKFHVERTFCRPLFVTFHAFIGRLPFLTAIAIDYIDTVAVRVVPFGSFRYHLFVLWCKHFIYFLSYLFDIFEIEVLENRHVNVDYRLLRKAIILLLTIGSSSSSPMPSSRNSLSNLCLFTTLLYAPHVPFAFGAICLCLFTLVQG